MRKVHSIGQKKKQLGQGMTEYIIIVALIAVAAIGAYGWFGSAVKHQVAGLANEISGTSASAQQTAAATAATNSAAAADAEGNDMGTFHTGATSAAKSGE